MNPSDVLQAIGDDLRNYSMEIQRAFPDFTRSLVSKEDKDSKSEEEIENIIENEPLIAMQNFYILEFSSWSNQISLRFKESAPKFLKEMISARFKMHLRDE